MPDRTTRPRPVLPACGKRGSPSPLFSIPACTGLEGEMASLILASKIRGTSPTQPAVNHGKQLLPRGGPLSPARHVSCHRIKALLPGVCVQRPSRIPCPCTLVFPMQPQTSPRGLRACEACGHGHGLCHEVPGPPKAARRQRCRTVPRGTVGLPQHLCNSGSLQ